MQVITRAIRASDGITYPEGTPLDKLPIENRASLSGTCWTRHVPTPVVAPKAVEPDPESVVESEADPEPESDSPEPAVPAEPMLADEPADESPSIATLDLADDIKEKLINAGIQTVAQAKTYAEANKGFRTIKGIVKTTNEQILAAIGE